MITVKQILEFLGADVIKVIGPEKTLVKYLRSIELVDEFTLDWINPTLTNKQFIAENSKARVLLCDQEVQYSNNLQSQNKTLIFVQNPKVAVAKIGNHFFVKKVSPEIHKSAFIHPHASIGKFPSIGANSSIGDCAIGDHVVIYPNVVINDDVIIGNNVVIKPGAIIGFDGFGYEKDLTNNWFKFPQLGRLIIQDNVEIGSLTCIDKGSLANTIIGYNTKINNLCHIAHNVNIGKNVIITAQVNVSGSTIIEDYVWIGPNVSLRGHQRIGEGAVIGMGAVVTKDVPPGEKWIGNPAKKMLI